MNFALKNNPYVKQIIRKPELLFIVFGLIFGLIFIFRLAPLSGTDEFTHFPRLYQISEGTLWEQRLPNNQFGGNLPSNVNDMVNDYRNLSRYPTGSSYLAGSDQLNAKYSKVSNPGNKQVRAIFTSTVIYPPDAYSFALIGLGIAKALHLPLIWYVYLPRISNLLTWLILGYLAIRLLPSGKWFLTALALTPTALTQAATISGDGILMGTAWLLIALVLAVSVGKVRLNWGTMLALLVISAIVAYIKDGYFLLGLLPLAIPGYRFASKRFNLVFKSVNILMIVVIAAAFTLRTVHAVKGVVLTPTYGMIFSSQQQISFMVHNFFSYGWHLIEQPFTKTFDTTYLGIVGIITNRLIYLSILVIGLIYLCLFRAYTMAVGLLEIRKNLKTMMPIFLAIFFFTYLLLASAFYIGNTSVGSTYVNGFYGRYFLPIIPLLLIIPMSLKTKRYAVKFAPLALAGSVIGLVTTIFSLQ